MIRYFSVAGHKFSLDLDAGCDDMEKLFNYLPFEIAEVEDGGTVFGLKVSIDPSWHSRKSESFVPVYVAEGDPDEPRLDLYGDDACWWVEMAPVRRMAPVAALQMTADFTSGTLLCGDPKAIRFAVDNAAMLMFAFRTSTLGTLEMHASVIMREGKAYLFLAKSGTGKSTHSRMWLENISGSELLNDDNPVVRVMPDGTIKVFGSPWSGKTPCYRNVSAGAGAMVRIRRCNENRITPQSVPEAYASVASSCSGFKPVESMAEGLHNTIAQVALNVPCFVLDCLPDADAAFTCFNGVCRK